MKGSVVNKICPLWTGCVKKIGSPYRVHSNIMNTLILWMCAFVTERWPEQNGD